MRIHIDNRATTRIQGILIIAILVVVSVLGAYYYYPTAERWASVTMRVNLFENRWKGK